MENIFSGFLICFTALCIIELNRLRERISPRVTGASCREEEDFDPGALTSMSDARELGQLCGELPGEDDIVFRED